MLLDERPKVRATAAAVLNGSKAHVRMRPRELQSAHAGIGASAQFSVSNVARQSLWARAKREGLGAHQGSTMSPGMERRKSVMI